MFLALGSAMRRHLAFASTVVALTFVSNSLCYGWNDRGHMMVAAVAYNKLTQQKKNRVDALLLLNPDKDNWIKLIPQGTSSTQKKTLMFMIAATWADRVKGNPDYHADGTHSGNRPPNDPSASQNIGYTDHALHKYWHFEDQPFTPDNTPLPPVPTPNLRTQISAFREVLASTKPDPLKSYDLSWLLHLVGDAHQPLHFTTRVSSAQPEGDDGGNGVALTASGASNLHSFWDDVLGTDTSPLHALSAISTLPNSFPGAVTDLDVNHWAKESLNVAEQSVYKMPIGPGAGPFTISQAYKTDAVRVAQGRIALAGARLAKILNEELK